MLCLSLKWWPIAGDSLIVPLLISFNCYQPVLWHPKQSSSIASQHARLLHGQQLVANWDWLGTHTHGNCLFFIKLFQSKWRSKQTPDIGIQLCLQIHTNFQSLQLKTKQLTWQSLPFVNMTPGSHIYRNKTLQDWKGLPELESALLRPLLSSHLVTALQKAWHEIRKLAILKRIDYLSINLLTTYWKEEKAEQVFNSWQYIASWE